MMKKNKVHLETIDSIEHKSKSDAMVLLKELAGLGQFKMISEQVVLSEQLVKDTQKQ
jgi:hypothetical protein